MIPSRRARCAVIYTVWNPDKDSVREPGTKETIVRDGRVYMMYFIAPEWGKCAEAERVVRGTSGAVRRHVKARSSIAGHARAPRLTRRTPAPPAPSPSPVRWAVGARAARCTSGSSAPLRDP